MDNSPYYFGKCSICKEFKALRYGICKDCQKEEKNEMPDFLRDLFKKSPNNLEK